MFSRRQIVQSCGAAAATLLTPAWLPARAESRQSFGCEQNRVQFIDADFAVTNYLEKIRAAGVRTVGRYYDRDYGGGPGDTCWHNPTKRLTKRELQALEHLSLLGAAISAKEFLAILTLIRDIPEHK